MRGLLPVLLARRYFHSRRRGASNAPTILAIVEIAAGVMTLTVVLAVMNGFQLGFIESIVEISSYHLQARPVLRGSAESPALDAGVVDRIRAVPGVTTVVPFVQRQALIDGAFQRPRVCTVRAVPEDLFSRDPVQARMLAPVSGDFDLSGPPGAPRIVLGAELAGALGARTGDVLSLSSFAAGSGGRPVPRRDTFVLAGTFRTGYYDFDSGLAFISLASADARYGGGAELPRTWGIKIADRFSDAGPLSRVSSILGGTGYEAESWRTYNRSFFDALFVEKLMMMVLVGLIFLVVGFNVFHSLRRGVHERMEEIALLKAVGVPPRRIRSTFILQGLFVGVSGAAAGLLAGLLVSVNVNEVFGGIERVINAVLSLARTLAMAFSPESAEGGFAIFSPAYFYLTRVPSHVFLQEAFLVVFFAIGSCVAAAAAATRAISRFRPSEVLRYE